MSYRKNKGLILRLFIFSLCFVPCFILILPTGVPSPSLRPSQVEASAVIGEEVIAALNQISEVSVAVALYLPEVRFCSYEMEKYNSVIAELQQSVLDGLDPAGYTLTHRFKSVPGLALRIRSIDVLYQLESNPRVRRIDLDLGGKGGLDDSRPLVNADQAHNLGLTGLGKIVAVLDSGIDSDHPNLAGALIDEHCFCYNPAGGRCPNGTSEQVGAGSAEDDHGHGTHVIGIITGDGNTAPRGIAPDTKIVAIKVLDSNNSFYGMSDITAALDWILNNRPDVDVVNMSLYTYVKFNDVCDDCYAWTMNLASAINNLRDKGILCISIPGNDSLVGQITAPGCISSCMAIGATDKKDSAASFSNSSELVDLFAPGVNIISTAKGGGSKSMTGTSMAAPHVTAAAAILRQKEPSLQPSELESALKTSQVYVTDAAWLTRPRLDVMAALDAVGASIPISGRVTLAGSAANATEGLQGSIGNVKDTTEVSGKQISSETDYKRDKRDSVAVAEGLSKVVMKGLEGSPVTDDTGYYSAKVKNGWSGVVTPSRTGFAFDPSSRSYSNVTFDQINQDYTASFVQYQLTISVGTGGTTDPLPGTYTYNYGTEVSIKAIADSGYKFSGWSGDVSGTTNPLTITMYANKSIKANFIRQYTLIIAAGTGGTTNPASGTYTYDSGTQVTITAVANSGYKFTGWSGSVSGTTNPITITMDSDKSITASFSPEEKGGEKKKPCFIASAAYGSPFHPYVKTLRDFRDKYLIPYSFGRKIVNFYYRYSPAAANFISKNKATKIAARLILLPFVALSYMMLRFGPLITAVAVALILAPSVLSARFYRRRLKSR